MSVLSVIQDHCRLHALSVPTAVIGSTDTQVVQLLAHLNSILEDIVTESKFQGTTQECVFIAQASEDQGSLATLAGNGFIQANFETFFDRTLARPLYGPLDDHQWQEIKALPNPGPFYKFRIRGDHLLFAPVPAAPLSTIAFEFMSSWCVRDGTTGDLKAAITADSDTFVFPENIIKKFLTARWKHTKGLPYEKDEAKAYELLNGFIARDKVKTRVNVACPEQPSIKPGVFVPSGNWMQ